MRTYKPPTATRRKAPGRRRLFPDGPRLLAGSHIDGVQVADLARFGASPAAVISFLGIPPKLLQDAGFGAALKKEGAAGAATRKIDLLRLERRPQDFPPGFLAALRRMFDQWDHAHAHGYAGARGGFNANA